MNKKDQIVELRNQGLTRKEITKALGIDRDALNYHMKALFAEGRLDHLSEKEIERRRQEAVPYVLSDEQQIAEARRLRDEGLSFPEIGLKFGVCAASVCRRIGKGQRITPLQQQLIKLRLAGLTVDEIAARLGKKRGTVGVILARLVHRGIIERKGEDNYAARRASAIS